MADIVLQTLIDIFKELEGGRDMAVTIRKANTLKTEGKSLLIYGDSGFGKTYAAGTLPEGKTLIIDIDVGVETLSKTDHEVVRPDSVAELKEIYEGLRDGSLAYRFVVIDSLTELEKRVQMFRKQAKGKEFISMKEYGETSELMREYMRKFRDLRNEGISVIFTALEMPLDIQVTESDTQTKAVPMLSKKFALEACGLVDMVARLVINPNSGERELHFAGSREFLAKTRVHAVNPVEPPDLTMLYRKIFGIKAPKDEAASQDEAKGDGNKGESKQSQSHSGKEK